MPATSSPRPTTRVSAHPGSIPTSSATAKRGGTIDIVRAARNLPEAEAGTVPRRVRGVAGRTRRAVRRRDRPRPWAPELQLVAVNSEAPGTELPLAARVLSKLSDGQSAVGVFMTSIGMHEAYPQADLAQILTPLGLSMVHLADAVQRPVGGGARSGWRRTGIVPGHRAPGTVVLAPHRHRSRSSTDGGSGPHHAGRARPDRPAVPDRRVGRHPRPRRSVTTLLETSIPTTGTARPPTSHEPQQCSTSSTGSPGSPYASDCPARGAHHDDHDDGRHEPDDHDEWNGDERRVQQLVGGHDRSDRRPSLHGLITPVGHVR